MKVGVLAMQGAVRRHRRVLEDLGVAAVEVRRPGALDEVDALIIPGGESTTISMMLESTELFEPLAQRLATGMPALGTCAGMILLARGVVDGRPDRRTFGALDIDVRRNAYGTQLDSFETDLAVPALGDQPLHAAFIRAPVVTRVGPSVEVLAAIDDEVVMCRQGQVMATSFHPELGADTRLHELFLSAVEPIKE